MKRGNINIKNISELLLLIVILILVNYLSGIRFFRLDLTTEKRFTLHENSRKIMQELTDVIYVRVFLGGELPPDLIRFRQSIKEILIGFRAYAGKNLEFEFINPYDETEPQLRKEIMADLADKGLRMTDVRIPNNQGGYSTKLIFPGALISYKGIEFPVNLLKNNPGLPYQVNLNNSVQSLEYEFIRAFKSLTGTKLEKIAFIEGHRELDHLQVQDISSELSLFFQVDRGTIGGNLTSLLNYKALIIAQPLERFNDRDKFVLDQYIMRGGKVLLFLDPVQTHTDSLRTDITYTEFRDINIYDLLFKYGIRVSYNIIKDIQCNYIKVERLIEGQPSGISFLPWVYYPLLTSPDDHTITKGLNYIRTQFVSAIDTTSVMVQGLYRKVLLSSSDTSARIENPAVISLDELNENHMRSDFRDSKLPVAILAEGSFPSFYKNYGIPDGITPQNTEVLSHSEPAMIFVAGDGDMIRNDVQITAEGPVAMPLGYDKDTRQTFGNKEFIMNVVNYMTDDEGLIELRSREFKIRMMDKTKILSSGSRLKWQLANTVLPVGLIIAFGILFQLFRNRKYRGQ